MLETLNRRRRLPFFLRMGETVHLLVSIYLIITLLSYSVLCEDNQSSKYDGRISKVYSSNPCTKIYEKRPSKNFKSYERCLKVNGTLIPVTFRCPCGHYYDSKVQDCLSIQGGGEVVYVDYNGVCKDNYKGVMIHPTQKQFYYVCKDSGVVVVKCPKLQVFDRNKSFCVNVEDPKTITIYDESNGDIELPRCLGPGRYALPEHPIYFYMCTMDGDKFYRSVFKCPIGSHYDPVYQSCTQTYDITTVTSTIGWYLESDPYPPCFKPGKFRSPIDCSMYYICSAKVGGYFYQTRMRCPEGKMFCLKQMKCRPAMEVECDVVRHNNTDIEMSSERLPITREYTTSQKYIENEFSMAVTVPSLEITTLSENEHRITEGYVIDDKKIDSTTISEELFTEDQSDEKFISLKDITTVHEEYSTTTVSRNKLTEMPQLITEHTTSGETIKYEISTESILTSLETEVGITDGYITDDQITEGTTIAVEPITEDKSKFTPAIDITIAHEEYRTTEISTDKLTEISPVTSEYTTNKEKNEYDTLTTTMPTSIITQGVETIGYVIDDLTTETITITEQFVTKDQSDEKSTSATDSTIVHEEYSTIKMSLDDLSNISLVTSEFTTLGEVTDDEISTENISTSSEIAKEITEGYFDDQSTEGTTVFIEPITKEQNNESTPSVDSTIAHVEYSTTEMSTEKITEMTTIMSEYTTRGNEIKDEISTKESITEGYIIDDHELEITTISKEFITYDQSNEKFTPSMHTTIANEEYSTGKSTEMQTVMSEYTTSGKVIEDEISTAAILTSSDIGIGVTDEYILDNRKIERTTISEEAAKDQSNNTFTLSAFSTIAHEEYSTTEMSTEKLTEMAPFTTAEEIVDEFLTAAITTLSEIEENKTYGYIIDDQKFESTTIFEEFITKDQNDEKSTLFIDNTTVHEDYITTGMSSNKLTEIPPLTSEHMTTEEVTVDGFSTVVLQTSSEAEGVTDGYIIDDRKFESTTIPEEDVTKDQSDKFTSSVHNTIANEEYSTTEMISDKLTDMPPFTSEHMTTEEVTVDGFSTVVLQTSSEAEGVTDGYIIDDRKFESTTILEEDVTKDQSDKFTSSVHNTFANEEYSTTEMISDKITDMPPFTSEYITSGKIFEDENSTTSIPISSDIEENITYGFDNETGTTTTSTETFTQDQSYDDRTTPVLLETTMEDEWDIDKITKSLDSDIVNFTEPSIEITSGIETTTPYEDPTDECSTTPIIPIEQAPICTEEGVFSYNNSCFLYYECMYDEDGELVANMMECPKCLRFNNELGYCDLPQNVPRCYELYSNPDVVCESEGLFSIVGVCDQYKECILRENGEFLKIIRTCPEGMNFNNVTKECDSLVSCPNQTVPKCEKVGMFQDSERCNEFYQCILINETETFTFKRFRCPPSLVFNEKIGACDFARNVPGCANLYI